MSRFDATLCTTAIVMVALVLGFAIVRPPASRPDSQAAPSSASPLRRSSERLPAGLAGTPEDFGWVTAGVPLSQSPPSPAVRVTTAAGHWLSGLATWYCCTHGYSSSSYVAAAGPALRLGAWRGRYVTVWSGLRHVRVRLVDYCVCRAGVVIDLHPGAFRSLAPLSRGVVRVRVTW